MVAWGRLMCSRRATSSLHLCAIKANSLASFRTLVEASPSLHQKNLGFICPVSVRSSTCSCDNFATGKPTPGGVLKRGLPTEIGCKLSVCLTYISPLVLHVVVTDTLRGTHPSKGWFIAARYASRLGSWMLHGGTFMLTHLTIPSSNL